MLNEYNSKVIILIKFTPKKIFTLKKKLSNSQAFQKKYIPQNKKK